MHARIYLIIQSQNQGSTDRCRSTGPRFHKDFKKYLDKVAEGLYQFIPGSIPAEDAAKRFS